MSKESAQQDLAMNLNEVKYAEEAAREEEKTDRKLAEHTRDVGKALSKRAAYLKSRLDA